MAEEATTTPSSLAWFTAAKPTYSRLVDTLIVLLKLLLHSRGIPFVDVQGRVKADDSFAEKIKTKKYSDPQSQITDVAGLRIITLVESDILRAQEVISENFKIHRDDSVDKSSSLGVDKVGYRSVHLICEFGQDRTVLPEFRSFADLRFEVQIRTALQHAWAEIEHDRGYKLKGELPSHLKRKFALLAGLLELADSQFDELTAAINKYSSEIFEKQVTKYSNVELNSSSILIYLASKFGSNLKEPKEPGLWSVLLDEIRDFGVSDLHAFDALLTDDILEKVRSNNAGRHVAGIVRDTLMFTDLRKYFSESWKGTWDSLNRSTRDVLVEIHGREIVRTELKERHIRVFPGSSSRLSAELNVS